MRNQVGRNVAACGLEFLSLPSDANFFASSVLPALADFVIELLNFFCPPHHRFNFVEAFKKVGHRDFVRSSACHSFA